jgi:pimeloyl-ACP methyl ester carboxylesterase
MLKEKIINLGKVEINYAEGPKSGSPILLIHGLPGHWQEFIPVLPTLILKWHVYALDLRGQGKSGRVSGQYLSKYYVEDTVKFIQSQFEEPVILYGQSAGGVGALSAASQIPTMVKGVILGDSPIEREVLIRWMTSDEFKKHFSELQKIAKQKDQSKREIAKKIADIPVKVPGQDEEIRYGDSPGMDDIRIQQLAIVLAEMDPGVLEYHATGRAVEFLEGLDFKNCLRRIHCPVLLLQADPAQGGMMTSAGVQYVKSVLPNTEHAFFKSMGHDLGLETWNVAAWLRVVTNFLSMLSM